MSDAPKQTEGPTRAQSWPIRLRLALLVPGDHRWNAWVRDITAKLERRHER